jgi:cytochrome b6-f complex iron-sulfur subunit
MDAHDTPETPWSVTRRRLFTWIGWSSFASFFGALTVATVRFFFPRVLYEPSSTFEAGKPADYQVGVVDTRHKHDHRVWMVRTAEGMYALIAICTHLGCTPNWFGSEDRFKCPCHGSVFLRNGDNVAGPAPVPLYRAAIGLDISGNLVVNKAFQENRPDKRDQAPFFLPLSEDGQPSA